jgi:hypothetical protein
VADQRLAEKRRKQTRRIGLGHVVGIDVPLNGNWPKKNQFGSSGR